MSKILKMSSPHISGAVKLPASKSISNRLLILQALYGGFDIANLSDAEDTQLLRSDLNSNSEIVDVGHAGTAMRFLLAYYTAKGEAKTLTGSDRMKQRPIGPLVDALNIAGARIEYLEKKGYPPVRIHPQQAKGSEISIDGSISSQFISALLMVGPYLPNGLQMNIEGGMVSKPYIEMTLELMEGLGLKYQEALNSKFQIENQKASFAGTISVEYDWSSASYWYALAALSQSADITLKGLSKPSLQGDSNIRDWMEDLGVSTTFDDKGAHLRKTDFERKKLFFDFTSCPDLAQTIVVVCAALDADAEFTGLETLRIKETDRIAALQIELRKFGKELVEFETGNFKLEGVFKPIAHRISTYNDHRMAMAFTPLVMLCGELEIEEPQVVKKSYPDFWEELSSLI